MYGQGARPLNSNSIICSISIFSPNQFCFFFVFKCILLRKYWRGGGGLVFEVGAIEGKFMKRLDEGLSLQLQGQNF